MDVIPKVVGGKRWADQMQAQYLKSQRSAKYWAHVETRDALQEDELSQRQAQYLKSQRSAKYWAHVETRDAL